MSEPQIRFFDEEGHSVQLCAKLQPSAPAQWPYMQWLAWPGACCLHRPAADSHREICQELPAILTMSRAPAATQMQELVIKISQLEEKIRRRGDIVKSELVHSMGNFIRARTQPLDLGAFEALICIRDADKVRDAGAALDLRSLQRDVRDLVVCRIRGFRTFPNVEADRAAFEERYAALVSLYEEKHRRTIEDWFGLRAQLILAFSKQPPRHQ